MSLASYGATCGNLEVLIEVEGQDPDALPAPCARTRVLIPPYGVYYIHAYVCTRADCDRVLSYQFYSAPVFTVSSGEPAVYWTSPQWTGAQALQHLDDRN